MPSRPKIPDPERFKLWVRSGGRCQICRRYLLEGQLAARELTFGEAAHIIGQTESEKSPRGLDEDLSADDRDKADNLMLLCDDEHSEIDKMGSRDAFTPDFLRELKRRHEDRVHLATSFGEYDRTTPLRMIGNLRGRPVDVGRDAAAAAVMATAGRMPRFDLSTRNAIEIDLRNIPGEEGPEPHYYASACAAIDKVIKNKVADALTTEEVVHLSVFAFARLPLLVYLGAQIDDTVPVDIYQRHRSTEDWKWPNPDATATFTTTIADPTPAESEAVLIVNVSGTIKHDELPVAVRGLPLSEITIVGTAHTDVLAGPGALAAFSLTLRKFLAELETGHKHVRLLHLFAAIPLSAGVALGRVFAPEVHPSVQLYDRTDSGDYVEAIRVGER
ncbi:MULTISPECIES: SAVED domain-containing protein [unclassified Rhodococcus (in: high G+C Gram-positive bacteria)]|uniref:SAVED domain-containing protein n=1 Tax=unclassified Rhodococcus (in: high G+C Gram-positive bacteria) TaxID=192944 RepID=UPI00031AD1F4|nr:MULTISPECIES: SAVED domain-containing protein [unclassified Rhodococcus (in: high G+C Gram-positive bacteria)]MBC2644996.1 SAVED domain-containing protein [Rhodococcus sp. 3A]MBC2898070.1 SAVED domain-containing protein [Rhodococcus sp. 4CII]